jgi:hypothetical protein
MKVQIIKVPGDNHCFFHSMIHHLKRNTNSSLKLKLSVKKLRTLVAKTISKLSNNDIDKSFVNFYLNDQNMSLKQYTQNIQRNMWAGPLEAFALSKALKIRIQIFNKSDLSKKGKSYVIKSDPIIDFGDKRKQPLRVVIYGFDFISSIKTGCHYDALEVVTS